MLEREIWRAISKRVEGPELVASLRALAPQLIARPGTLVHRHSTRVIFSHGPVPAPPITYALPPSAGGLLERGGAGPIVPFHVQLVPSRRAPVAAEVLGGWWQRLAEVLEAAAAAGFSVEKETRNGVRVHRPDAPYVALSELRYPSRTAAEAHRALASELFELYRRGGRQLQCVGAWDASAIAVAAYDEQGSVLRLMGRPILQALLPVVRSRTVMLSERGVRIVRRLSLSSSRLAAAPELFDPYRWSLP